MYHGTAKSASQRFVPLATLDTPDYRNAGELPVDGRVVVAGRTDTLGALGLFGARLYLLITPSIMLGALLGTSLPANVVFLTPALGVLLVAPRQRFLKLPVPTAIIVLLGWMVLSYLWSIDKAETLFSLREDIAPILGLIIVIGLLPVDESVKWFVRGIKAMVALSLIVLILFPETRTSFLQGSESDAWSAWFRSKNQLGRSALVAYMVLLSLDKTRISRLLGIAASLILVLGSSSATAVAGVLFVTGAWVWGRQFRRVGAHSSISYLLTSIAGGITAIVAAFASAAWLVSLLGRDLSFSGRSGLWAPSMEYITEKPWLGYGYRALFASESPESLDLWREIGFRAAHSHNGPIEVALGLGVIGLALFLVVYLSTLTSALRYLKTNDVALFAVIFLLLQLVVAVVEPVFDRDWFTVVVVIRMLLFRMQSDERRQLSSAPVTT